MHGLQVIEHALEGGNELHSRQFVAGGFAVRRHVERHGRIAAREQGVDHGPELPSMALEAVDQQHDRYIGIVCAPSPSHQPLAEIDTLIGLRQLQARRRPHVAARRQHHASKERRHQAGRHVAGGSPYGKWNGGNRGGQSGHVRISNYVQLH